MTQPPIVEQAVAGRGALGEAARRGGATPLLAICIVSFLCSIGTGVVWVGVPFIAKHHYGFSKQTTLGLFLVLGATYVIGALMTGTMLRALERRLSPRGALMLILALAALACSGLLLTDAGWMLWAVALAINILSSWLWPIIESYLTASRHGRDMRHALGVWNLTWTGAIIVALVAMAPLVERHTKMSLVATGGLFLLGLLALQAFGRAPGSHVQAAERAEDGEHEADALRRREYPHLLHAARIMLLLSYVLIAAMSPLLPFLIERLGVAAASSTLVAALWTVSRFATVAFMWRAGFWHGRWGTLLLGGLALVLGFALIVASASLAAMIAGLVLIGAGMGVIYYAALYYAMTVGRAQVDAGGKHEALIGLGYTAGPAAGFAGLAMSEPMSRTALGPDGGVIVLMFALALIAGAAALQPYRRAHRLRGIAVTS